MRTLLLLGTLLLLPACEQLSRLLGEELSREQQLKRHLERGEAALQAGQLEHAEKFFEQAAAVAMNDPAPQRALARTYVKMGEDVRAALALKAAVRLEPDDPELRVQLGELYLKLGKPTAALEQLQAAGADTEREPAGLGWRLAAALLRTGNPDEALRAIHKAAEKQPRDADVLAVHAEVLMALRDEVGALRLLETAVGLAPGSPRVRTVRARYFYQRGKVAEALREYDRAVEADPTDWEVAMARARAMASSGRLQDAAKEMERICAARPNDMNAVASLAEVKLLAGEEPAAQELAEIVLSNQPKNGRALYVRARSIEATEKADSMRVINAYREVLESDVGLPEAFSRLWRLHLARDEKVDAISALEHLVVLGEATPEEERQLASLYAQTGLKSGRGLQQLRSALRRESGKKRPLTIQRQADSEGSQSRR